jgi:MFS family permease
MPSSSRPAWLWWMFAGTIVLSAFLLFLIQPLIAKILLPWFGGSTGVWATCVVFFQVMLVFGYAYAHALTSYLTPKQQMVTHLSVLGLSVLAAGWSIMPADSWRPENSELPILKLGLLLLRYVGLPYFALSTTGPLVQAWFARLFPGKTPYRLYALSNFGSLASLLLFPVVFEQFFGLSFLSTSWSLLFAVFAALAAGVAYLTWREAPNGVLETTTGQPEKKNAKLKNNELPTSEIVVEPTWASYALWLALPALASFMLVAGTNHLCQDVASVPFLWVMPLSLYLISFIICFDHERWYQRLVFAVVALAGLYMSAGMYSLEYKKGLSQGVLVRGTWPVTRPFYEVMDWYERPKHKDEILEYSPWLADQKKQNAKLDTQSSEAQIELRKKYKQYVENREEERYNNWFDQAKNEDALLTLNVPETKSYVEQKYKTWQRQRAGVNWLEEVQDVPMLDVNFIGQVLAHCVGLFGLFMLCHGELTRNKPPARYLTSFYMMIAIGGAIGGALVSLAAPFVFNTYAEWLVGLIAALLLTGGLLLDQPGGAWYKTRFFLLALPAAVVCLYILWQNSSLPEQYLYWADPEAYRLYLLDRGNTVLPDGQFSMPDGKLLGPQYVWPLMISLLAIIGIGFYAIWERAWQRDKLRFWVINLAMLLFVCFAVWDGLHFLGLMKQPEDQGDDEGNKSVAVVPFDTDESLAQKLKRAALAEAITRSNAAITAMNDRFRELYQDQEPPAVPINSNPIVKRKIFEGRNFYGALSISESISLLWPENSYRFLMHGRILHGNQFLEGPLRYQPTSYYTTDSGIGLAVGHFLREDSMQICAIGLGTGTIAAYGRQKGHDFTIYEINPLVEQLSATEDGYFKYIPDARAQGCNVEIVLGDARVQMQREAEAGKLRKYDVLVVDAFSGDSIPTHLLTREAMDAYVKHMRSDQAIIAIHISNRYLNLRPVCRGLAEYAKLNGTVVKSQNNQPGGSPSTWVLLTNNRDFLEQTVPNAGLDHGSIFHEKIKSILWTDDFTTLINILHGTGSGTEEEPEAGGGDAD